MKFLCHLRERYLWSKGNNNEQIKSYTKHFLCESAFYRKCFVWKKRCKIKTSDIRITKCRCYSIKYAECGVDVSRPLWCKLIQLKPIEVSPRKSSGLIKKAITLFPSSFFPPVESTFVFGNNNYGRTRDSFPVLLVYSLTSEGVSLAALDIAFISRKLCKSTTSCLLLRQDFSENLVEFLRLAKSYAWNGDCRLIEDDKSLDWHDTCVTSLYDIFGLFVRTIIKYNIKKCI